MFPRGLAKVEGDKAPSSLKDWTSVKRKYGLIGGIVFGGALTITLAIMGCSKATEPFKDADRGNTNTTSADTGTMPDGFSNWSTKCDH